jgi:nitric oxide reductase large subunit
VFPKDYNQNQDFYENQPSNNRYGIDFVQFWTSDDETFLHGITFYSNGDANGNPLNPNRTNPYSKNNPWNPNHGNDILNFFRNWWIVVLSIILILIISIIVFVYIKKKKRKI